MGMPVAIDLHDPDVDDGAVEEAFAWLRFVDDAFSTYKPDSEISRLRRAELRVADCHPHVRAVLARCERLRRSTGGYFDAGAGAALDPSGLVKGWAVERAAGILAAAGARNYAVNAGGDIQLAGAPADDDAWHVGIQHPAERHAVCAVLALTEGAVATSGAYERGEHVVDPHTGRAPLDVLSVTVVGPSLATADAHATAAFAMGARGARWLAGVAGYAGMVVCADETVLCTPGFDRHRDR
jgi:thiamine biosynthesis lipoprotein